MRLIHYGSYLSALLYFLGTAVGEHCRALPGLLQCGVRLETKTRLTDVDLL
jgi:hypothetical protein